MHKAMLALMPLALAACQAEYIASARIDEVVVPTNPPDLGPTLIHDVLHQGVPKSLDILWVIDNSNSMEAEQRKLADNFPNFIKYYRNSGLDWRIGVISTDMGYGNTSTEGDDGMLQGAVGYRYLDPTVPDPIGTFSQMAILGTEGNDREEALDAVQRALETDNLNGPNRGFYREDALFYVIFVSDENDFSRSLGPSVGPPTDEQVEPFVDWLVGLKADPELVTVSAIIGVDEECENSDVGRRYRQVVRATGGVEFDICSRDWTPILEDLAIQAVGLKREFFLSQNPAPQTLDVQVVDLDEVYQFEQDVDYIYDEVANSITFTGYTPRASGDVHVEYALLADFTE